MNKNLVIGSILLTVVVGGLLINNANKTPSSLTVVGAGTVSAKPEEFNLVVTKAVVGGDAGKAIDEAEGGIGKLMDIARKEGGDAAEIKKSFYQVSPQGDGTFIVANAFSLTSKKVEVVNALIKDLYANGATTISNAVFTTSDQNGTDQKARVEAIKDAKSQADQIAKAAGKRVGRVLSIADDNTKGSSSVGDAGANGLSSITITKNVSVVYEIK